MKLKKNYPEYKHYLYMLNNCNSPYDNCYTINNIKICTEWLGKDGFWTFLEDIGTKPSDNHKLFRKDSLCDYNKDNCIWSVKDPKLIKTEKSPVVLKREEIIYDNKIYKDFGKFCKAFNIPYKLGYNRKNLGWSLEEIINEPNQRKDPTRRSMNKFFKFF